MKIARLDHLVLTVADIERSCAFYTRVLGMEVVTFGEGRTALRFGTQKINLHPADNIPGLVADQPKVRFVDQGGGVKGVARVFGCHPSGREFPQLVIHQQEQVGSGLMVAGRCSIE